MSETGGTWPEHCEQRAFVAGALWWQFKTTGFTARAAERDEAQAEAIRRYGAPRPDPAPLTTEEMRKAITRAALILTQDGNLHAFDRALDAALDAAEARMQRIAYLSEPWVTAEGTAEALMMIHDLATPRPTEETTP